nr:putative mannitol 1-phosphate dehydrogenase [Oceanusvirus sp.]
MFRRSATLSLRGNVVTFKKRPERFRSEDNGLHVHFGAGRLGLGLVVPSIRKRVVVVQRPSQEWNTLDLSRSTVDLSVNGETLMELVPCLSAEDALSATSSLLIADDPKHILDVAVRATSFSCSIGRECVDALMPVLGALSLRLDDRPVMYACEEDSKAVYELVLALIGRVDVVPCTADRICVRRTVTETSIQVFAEKNKGQIVLYGEGVHPIDEGIATVVWDKEVAQYFRDENKAIVGSTRALAAFVTRSRGDSATIDVSLFDKTERFEWAVAVLMHLADKWGDDVVARARDEPVSVFPETIINTVVDVFDRIGDLDEETSDVFERGERRVYEEMISPIVDSYCRSSLGETKVLAHLYSATTPSVVDRAVRGLDEECANVYL